MRRTKAFVGLAVTLLALSTPSVATVNAIVVGQQFQITITGTDTANVDVNGSTIEVRDSTNAIVNTAPSGSILSISVNGSLGQTESVTFSGTLSLPNGVTVNGVETLSYLAAYDVGSSPFTAIVSKNISLQGSITSTSGPITLAANTQSPPTAGLFDGILQSSGSISSSTGAIQLQGVGGTNGGDGVAIASQIQSTGSGAGAATITITGSSASPINAVGVVLFPIVPAGSTISSIDGAISINGTGVSSAPVGVQLMGSVFSPQVLATGSATIAITGTGLGNGAMGVELFGNTTVQATNASIQISGNATGGTGGTGIISAGNVVTTGSGSISLIADVLSLVSGAINAGANSLTLQAYTTGANLNLGSYLTTPEWSQITAGTLVAGSLSSTGGIAVGGGFTSPAPTVSLVNAGPFVGGPVSGATSLGVTDASAAGHSWTISGVQVQQDSNGFILCSSCTSVAVTGGSGSDSFNVTPGPAVAISVDGGAPTPPTVPGDTLAISTTGLTSPTLTSTGTAGGFQGSATFGNAGTVAFSHIETLAPGPATYLSVTAPANATAGNAFNFVVTAFDVFNNIATGYGGTVHFTSSDATSVLPANSTLTNGVGTFSATLKTLGSQTITAADSVNAAITGTSNAIAVSAAAATHFSVSAPATATAGSAFNFTVTALDQFNNTATGYVGTVHFTSSDGAAVLPANSTLTNGVGTFSATLTTAGNQTITVTDSAASSITGTSNTIAVSAVAATHFTVSDPGTATAGSAFNFTVTALDQFNNTATGYIGTVHFTSSDGASMLPANSTLTNGVGTFSATLKTAGSQTITATDSVNAAITGTSNTTAVSAGAGTHFSVSAPASATAGSAFNFTVTALDQFNNTATGYIGTVHFTSSDGASVLPANSTLTNGVGTFSATLKTAGSQTITATDSVNAAITGTSNTTAVSAGAGTHFSVSAPAASPPNAAFNFTVTALDQFNNTATAYAGTLHFTSSDATSVLPANSTLTNGVGTFSATLKTLGSQTITATDTISAALTGTSAAIVVASNSFTAPSPTGAGNITASFTGGGGTCSFASPQFIGPPPGGPPIPPTLPVSNASFPFGMFDFSLVNCTPGSTITMTIIYPGSIAGARYWKYGPQSGRPLAHWYVLSSNISGNTATFTLTDGGVGDDDLSVNGTIDDQGGPGFGTDPIPTLSDLMLALLGLAVLALGLRTRRMMLSGATRP